jgi:hypothetical protein
MSLLKFSKNGKFQWQVNRLQNSGRVLIAKFARCGERDGMVIRSIKW